MESKNQIQMVDLLSQYHRLKNEIDNAISNCIESTQFIKGPIVQRFQEELSEYLGTKKVIACGNGTDALQIAMMALNLKPGDEVIVPAFTYVATAEVIALLGLTPVLVDVDRETFNISTDSVKEAVSSKTKAIVPVHLFGQCADMEELMEIANNSGLFVIEDNAQALGADYKYKDGTIKKSGTIGHVGCTSFFPSKNLGCFGDGGAMFTDDDKIANRIAMISNHGQIQQYSHEVIGVNSRLDAIQAAILLEKLKQFDDFNLRRNEAAKQYDEELAHIPGLQIPFRSNRSTHVFHQYTLIVQNGLRDKLREHLKKSGIPSMVYYPKPLQNQKAFSSISRKSGSLKVSEELCSNVLSLPIHTEMNTNQIDYIVNKIKDYFNG